MFLNSYRQRGLYLGYKVLTGHFLDMEIRSSFVKVGTVHYSDCDRRLELVLNGLNCIIQPFYIINGTCSFFVSIIVVGGCYAMSSS